MYTKIKIIAFIINEPEGTKIVVDFCQHWINLASLIFYAAMLPTAAVVMANETE